MSHFNWICVRSVRIQLKTSLLAVLGISSRKTNLKSEEDFSFEIFFVQILQLGWCLKLPLQFVLVTNIDDVTHFIAPIACSFFSLLFSLCVAYITSAWLNNFPLVLQHLKAKRTENKTYRTLIWKLINWITHLICIIEANGGHIGVTTLNV